MLAQVWLRQKALFGTGARWRSGSFPSSQEGIAKGKECQHLLQEEVHASVEEARASKMVGQQGAWTRWEKKVQMVRFVMRWWLLHQFPDPGSPGHHAKSSNPLHLGQERDTGLPPVYWRRIPFNTSWAAALRPWPMVATAGTMTRSLRQLRKQSPQPSSPADTDLGRETKLKQSSYDAT